MVRERCVGVKESLMLGKAKPLVEKGSSTPVKVVELQ